MFFIKIMRDLLGVEIWTLLCMNSIEITLKKLLEGAISPKIERPSLSSWRTSRGKEKFFQVTSSLK